MITQTYLKSLVSYDPLTGVLTWKTRPIESFATIGAGKAWNARYAGKTIGYTHKVTGYLHTRINCKPYQAHRLAWLYVNGSWPVAEVDHVSHDRADNRIINLREATRTQNSRNMSRSKTNKSGFTGVSWYKRDSKWRAQVKVNGKTKNLGHFLDIKDAVAAREQANAKYNFHSNHGCIA